MSTVGLRATTEGTLDPSRKCKDRANLSRSLVEQLDLSRHDHLRLDNGPYATYYQVYRVHDGGPPMVVHENSLGRLAATDGMTVELSTTVPQEEFEEAREHGGLSETLMDDGQQDKVLVTAPHGGSIEAGTGKMARRAFERLQNANIPVSLWMLQGYRVPGQDISPFRVWHIGKPMQAVGGYPGLKHIVDRDFDVVVGFHRSGYDQIEVGGRIDAAIRERVAKQLRDATGRTVWTDHDRLRLPGTHSDVSVNFLTDDADRGLHLECTPGTCNQYQDEVAKSVVNVIRDIVQPAVPRRVTRQLGSAVAPV